MTWKPLLDPADALTGSAWEAVNATIEAILSPQFLDIQDGSGEIGYEAPLLLGYLALSEKSERWTDEAVRCLNVAIDRASVCKNLALHGGLSGIGFVVEHLSRRLLENSGSLEGESDEDLSYEIEAALLTALRPEGWQGLAYGTVDGLVGFGLYFLERFPLGKSAEGIRLVLDRLADLSTKTVEGRTWHTNPALLAGGQRQEFPAGYYDMGVAHGIPGILYFLGEIAGSGTQQERAAALLSDAVDWLTAQKDRHTNTSCFPACSDMFSPQPDSCNAWSYGDLGIAAVLLHVANRLRKRDWREFAQGLVDRCLARPVDISQADDAGLYRGAAGVAHIFNRIYQSHGDDRCRSAALDWFKYALALREPGSGFGGFIRRDANSQAIGRTSDSLLDGATGIALALLAALTAIEPQWDRTLLLSGRDGRQTPLPVPHAPK